MSRGTYTGHPGNVSGRGIAHQTTSKYTGHVDEIVRAKEAELLEV